MVGGGQEDGIVGNKEVDTALADDMTGRGKEVHTALGHVMAGELLLAHVDDVIDGDRQGTEEQLTHVTHNTGAITIEAVTDEAPQEGVQTLTVPKMGMAFESAKEAYDMYNAYAGKVGFSIRRGDEKCREDGSIYLKHIVCSNQGYRKNKSSKKDTTRTGCNAHVQFSVSREGIWTVQKVVLDHNHYLASPNKRHKLRSQRSVTEADMQLIGQIREGGMKPAQIYEFMKKFYGGADKVPYSRMDCNNVIGRQRKKYLESNDTQTLLEYLKNKQREDPTFFYAMEIDKDDGRIANFFWADGQSIMYYACFGDAVSFDTIFSTNKFAMPFAPILGTNHHKQTIIFGAALLFNETTESFVWLFESFLTAMSGKHPSTIFTDQDAAMAGAIAYVFRNTSHRLCLFHIYVNAGKHLGHVIHKHPEKFLSDFKRCVYEDRSEFYFQKKWKELLLDYNLEDNEWMRNLYGLREKWAASYHDSFTADINSTQRTEGMNNVFKKRFGKKLGISELLIECDNVSSSLRENELDEDFQSRRMNPVTYIPNLPILKTAAESYTRRMYSEFEEEFKEQFSFSCKLLQSEGSILKYMVMHMHSDYGATVIFNKEQVTISCSCRKYESIGILCKHAFKVFNANDVFILPPQYILNRWTKYAKRGYYIEKQGTKEESLKTQAARVSRKATSVALKCSLSKELLNDLEKAIDKLDLEADVSLSKLQEKANEIPLVSAECSTDTLNGKISFIIPKVVKGPKTKRGTISLEKKIGKKEKSQKKKSQKKKGENSKNAAENRYGSADGLQFIDPNDGSFGSNNTIPNFANDVYGQSSSMVAPLIHEGYANATMPHFNMYNNSSTIGTPYIQGGYTDLLLGVDRAATLQPAVKKLNFDGAPTQENI